MPPNRIPGMAQMVEGWEERLTKDQREQVEWMRVHKATVYVVEAPEDPLHDLPAEIVLEVIINKHSMFKIRGNWDDFGEMLDHGYMTVKNVFDYVRNK